MERHFPDCVKEAWDSTPVAPEHQPASLLCSEDSGLCPLPFYPVLGKSSGSPSELLSSPCWRLHWVFPKNEVLPRAQSTSEPRPALPTGGLWLWTQEEPEASSGEVDPAEEPDRLSHPQLPSTGTPRLATEGWRRPDLAHPSMRRRLPLPAQGSPVRAFSGFLDWIAHTVYSLSCRLCRSIFGTKGPETAAGAFSYLPLEKILVCET